MSGNRGLPAMTNGVGGFSMFPLSARQTTLPSTIDNDDNNSSIRKGAFVASTMPSSRLPYIGTLSIDISNRSSHRASRISPDSNLMHCFKFKDKKKVATKACINCRKSHACCEDERPCKRCIYHGLECTDDISRKRGPKGKGTTSIKVSKRRASSSSSSSNDINSPELSSSTEPSSCEEDSQTTLVVTAPSSPNTPIVAIAAATAAVPTSHSAFFPKVEQATTPSPTAHMETALWQQQHDPPPWLAQQVFPLDSTSPNSRPTNSPIIEELDLTIGKTTTTTTARRNLQQQQQQQHQQQQQEHLQAELARNIRKINIHELYQSFKVSRDKVAIFICVNPPYILAANDCLREKWGFIPISFHELVHPMQKQDSVALTVKTLPLPLNVVRGRFVAQARNEECFEFAFETSIIRDNPGPGSTCGKPLLMVSYLYFY